MDVRKFEAFTMPDAIKLVKKELGRDAVILSTKDKEVMSSETGKMVKLVEVLAAASASSEASTQRASSRQAQLSAQARPVEFPRLERKSETTIVKGSSLFNVQQKLENSLKSRFSESPLPVAVQTQVDSSRQQGNQNLQSDLAGMRLELEKMRQEIETIPQVSYGDQMEEIKILLHDLMRTKTVSEADTTHPYLNDICLKLRAAGTKESLLTELVQHLIATEPMLLRGKSDSASDPLRLKEQILSSSIRYLFKQFQVTGDWKLDPNRQTVICLVGPTGVGKTTTAAKLAAKYKLIEKRSISLVSMDTYRVGGVEQLRTYSKILDCPFAEVSDPKDLETFFVKQQDSQVIIIDSAGFSPRTGMDSVQLKALQNLPVAAHFQLVVSSNTKQRDLEETVKNYRILGPKSLIFTKLDESWGFGEILNTAVFSKLPLSYFTTGQKVPEDLEAATKERVIERLLRL